MRMQPAGTEVSTRIAAIIDEFDGREGPLLPILHGVQAEFGFMPPEAVPVIAQALNLSRAEVHGVVTFYHDFRQKPAGRHVLKLCQAEACQAMGSDDVTATLKRRLGIDLHETTPDGALTIEPVYCLGLCACAPAALLDGEPIGRIDEARIDEIVAEARR